MGLLLGSIIPGGSAEALEESVVSPYASVFQPPASAMAIQSGPDIAASPDGDFVVAWMDANQIVGQRFTGTGNPIGPQFLVAQSFNTEETYNTLVYRYVHIPVGPRVAVIPSLRQYAITWTWQTWSLDSHSLISTTAAASFRFLDLDLEWTSVDLAGVSIPDLSGGRQAYTRICVTEDEYLVAWIAVIQGSPLGGILAQRYSSHGAPLGDVFEVQQVYHPTHGLSLSCAEDGSFVVGWPSEQGALLVQAVDASNALALETPRVVADSPAGRFHALSLAPDGGLVVTYPVVEPTSTSIWLQSFAPLALVSGEPASQTLLLQELDNVTGATLVGMDLETGNRQVIAAWIEEDQHPVDPTLPRRARAVRLDTGSHPWQRLPWGLGTGPAEVPILNVAYPDIKADFTNSPTGIPPRIFDDVIAVSPPSSYGTFAIAWTAETGSVPAGSLNRSINVVMRCVDAYGRSTGCGPDKDGDHVLNEYDCDPLNRFLTYDLDQDGRCDELTGGTTEECIDECHRVYTYRLAVDRCVERCETIDNCDCADPAACPSWLLDQYQDTCAVYRECIEGIWSYLANQGWPAEPEPPDCDTEYAFEAQACQSAFGNPGQEDLDGNGVGDRCDSRLQGSITRFRSPTVHYLGGQCSGETYDVNVRLEGCHRLGPYCIPWDQRTTVGACACDNPTSPLCLTDTCNTADEKMFNGGLAFEAIQAPQSDSKPNIGDAGYCQYPTCELYLDELEPTHTEPTPERWVINKQLRFSHDPVFNWHSFSWRWRDFRKEQLEGKKARVRVAWQEPTLTGYHYRDDPDSVQIHYSDDWLLMETGCQEIGTPQFRGIDKPELHIKPQRQFRPDARPTPFPYVMRQDVTGDGRYLISYGDGLRVEGIETVSYDTEAGPRIQETAAAVTVASLHAELVGGPSGETDVMFRLGGRDPSGALTNAFWIGLPEHSDVPFRRAEEIYGPRAGEAPTLDSAHLVHDRRGDRLIAIGARATLSSAPSVEVWTFDLSTGVWSLMGLAPLSASDLAAATVHLDPGFNRALLVLPAGSETAPGPALRQLDLDTLRWSQLETVPAAEGPYGVGNHGAYLEPVERALYLYGGLDAAEAQVGAFRLDLRTLEWAPLPSPGPVPAGLEQPFVVYDRIAQTLWVASTGEVGATEGLTFHGLSAGAWRTLETLRPPEPGGPLLSGTFDPTAPAVALVPGDEAAPLPGPLRVVRLDTTDPSVGLEVRDGLGVVVGRDDSGHLTKSVVYYGRTLHRVEVVPLPGLTSGVAPTFQVTVHEADLVEVGSYTTERRVSDLLWQGSAVYLVGVDGLRTVDMTDPPAPTPLTRLELRGVGMGITRCGEVACVAEALRGSSLETVSLEDPFAPQKLGSLRTPGVSRQVAARGARYAYLADGGFGVSIVDLVDPAHPVAVGRIATPGLVTATRVHGTRLLVATWPQPKVWIYDVTEETAPALLGSFTVSHAVSDLRQSGSLVHVTGFTWAGWQSCLSGNPCVPGTEVEVYDVSDPAAATWAGDYDGGVSPFVGLQTSGEYGVVRTARGFTVYQAVERP